MVGAVVLGVLVAIGAVEALAGRTDQDGDPLGRLAMTVDIAVGRQTDRVAASTARVNRRPLPRRPTIPLEPGSPTGPFVPLPAADEPRAIISSTGVALPVIDRWPSGWLVSTPCQAVRLIDTGTPVGRAHVVLDPGHGGAEPGAVGPTGLVEKDLNLAVAREAARLLTEAGATVVLTRNGDHTMTAAARGLVARAVEPALLVSIHHNGGAPPGDGGPGTIVFTAGDSPDSTRFGGLVHQQLQPVLEAAAAEADERHGVWNAEVDRYDAELEAHHHSIAARDAALVANGQVPPAATTTVPHPTTVPPRKARVPRLIEPAVTTTVAASAPITVAVPETLPRPDPPAGEPVAPFRWAGSGNAGVRSWTRPDGQDQLALLRHRGDTPAALVEFVYLTNPSEEALLADPGFLQAQAGALAEAITRYLAGESGGTGFVADQVGDQPIGGSGGRDRCIEPPLE